MRKTYIFVSFLPIAFLWACQTHPSSDSVMPSELVEVTAAKRSILNYPLYGHSKTPGETDYYSVPAVVWDGYTEESRTTDPITGIEKVCLPVEKGSVATYEMKTGFGDEFYLFAYLSNEAYEVGKNGFAQLSTIERDISRYFDANETVIDGKYLSGYAFAQGSNEGIKTYRGDRPAAPYRLEDGSRLAFACSAKEGEVLYNLSLGAAMSQTITLLKHRQFVISNDIATINKNYQESWRTSRIDFNAGQHFAGCYEDTLFDGNAYLYSETGSTAYPIYKIDAIGQTEVLIAPTASTEEGGTNYLEDELPLEEDLYGSHKSEFHDALVQNPYGTNPTLNCNNGAFDYQQVKSIAKNSYLK